MTEKSQCKQQKAARLKIVHCRSYVVVSLLPIGIFCSLVYGTRRVLLVVKCAFPWDGMVCLTLDDLNEIEIAEEVEN